MTVDLTFGLWFTTLVIISSLIVPSTLIWLAAEWY